MISSYSWNIENWITRYLRKKRRTTINIAWIKTLLSPLQEKADEFAAKTIDFDFRIKYNSQQKVLESLLNTLFDPSLKRIRIVTTTDIMPPVIIYDDTENPDHAIIYDESEAIDGPILYDQDEIDANYDFRIMAPAALSGQESKILAWVERYRIGSKKYTIIYE